MKKTIALCGLLFCLYSFHTLPPSSVERIQQSGNGSTFEQAFEVFNTVEIYGMLDHLNVESHVQLLYYLNGCQYDVFHTNEGTIYFKFIKKRQP